MNFFVWSGLYSFIANLFIGSFVFLRNPKEKTNRLFGFFSLLVSCWSVGSWLENILPNQALALWVLRINYLFGIWLPPVYLDFIYTMASSQTRQGRNYLKIGYVLSGILSPFVLTPYFIPHLRRIGSSSYFISYPGPIYYLFFIFFVVFMAEVLRFTFIEMRNKRSLNRNTFRHLALANCLAIFAGFEYFSRVFGLFKSPPIDDYILVLYVLVLAFAIARHRLFDLEEVAQAVQKDRLAAIGLLSASINHEIRSPLFVIKGYAETLLESLENGSYKNLPEGEREKRMEQALEKTIEQASRVVEITKRLTDFSKPAREGSVTEPVNLNEVVDNVLSFVGHGLKVDNVTVEKALNPGLTIQGDRKEMEQIFLNLTINASQAMEKRTGQIKIEAREKEASNGKWKKVEIRLSDTGPGIPPDKINSIFEPFFTTKEAGTGLGLYVTKQLVERNSGRISVESQPGRGTTFVLEFRKSGK